MYIRKVNQQNRQTGKQYHTYRLVETYRNIDGKVRQKVLLNLGTHFEVPQEKWKILADRIEDAIKGQQQLFTTDPDIEELAQSIAKRVAHRVSARNEAVPQEKRDYCTIDINSIDHQQVKFIGAEHVGLETVKQLELDKLLEELNFNRKQINSALGNIIGRLIAPASERATHKYLHSQSGLDELLHCDFQQLSLNQLYQISDKLLKNKAVIEERLFQKEKDLFQLEEIITLYDLTNTYFEGKCLANRKAAYGRSKERRNDCPLVTLGLVLDSSGFPKRSEVYEGNIGESKTLEKMLQRLVKTEKPTIVLDAGIATEENINWLKEQGYNYIVVSRKAKPIMPDEYSIIKHKKDYLIKAKLVKNEASGESELYCYSELKAEKEAAINKQHTERYELELRKLSDGLKKKGTVKKYTKIMERIGRLKEKYKRIGYTYEVKVTPDESQQNAIGIEWQKIETKQKHPGVYCLRSNRDDIDTQTFWDIYIMLTDLEASFRCLKSELGLRPIYHHKTSRVDSHIFISVLAYHLLHTIRYQLKQKGIHESWETIRKELQTHCRITTTIKCKNGKTLNIRKTCLANPRQIEIYQALGILTNPGITEKSFF